LNQLAALDDEAVRLSVISDIEAALKSGYSLETPRLLSIVDFLATDAVIRTEMDGKKVMHDFPRVREKAVGLLAQYGNLESIPLLLSALGAEHDPLVRRALIKALAAQKSDPEGHAMKLLCTLARAEARSDTLLALDILSAIENISQYQGALSKEGFDACFMLSKSDVKEVSEKARSVLLKRYR
jgi:HEAT repeat protein